MHMAKQKLTPTTKTIDDLYQLYSEGRLNLRPDYQRNGVWPPKARAYLVDTVLMDRPIPMLFVARTRDANTNKMGYRVIDGQQRLRAVFAYLENRFGATESKSEEIKGKRFKKLSADFKDQFMGYSFVIMEMAGYTEPELRDIFARINKYVVRLNLQELRDAERPGPFKDFVDSLSNHEAWSQLQLFSKSGVERKRNKEFVAELIVLLLDGAQDKKGSLDLYYAAAPEQLEDTDAIRKPVLDAAFVARDLVKGQGTNVFKKLPAFYGLMGALYELLDDEERQVLLKDNIKRVRVELEKFANLIAKLPANPEEFKNEQAIPQTTLDRAYRFKDSIGRQTDNVKPRTARIEVLRSVIESALPVES